MSDCVRCSLDLGSRTNLSSACTVKAEQSTATVMPSFIRQRLQVTQGQDKSSQWLRAHHNIILLSTAQAPFWHKHMRLQFLTAIMDPDKTVGNHAGRSTSQSAD